MLGYQLGYILEYIFLSIINFMESLNCPKRL